MTIAGLIVLIMIGSLTSYLIITNPDFQTIYKEPSIDIRNDKTYNNKGEQINVGTTLIDFQNGTHIQGILIVSIGENNILNWEKYFGNGSDWRVVSNIHPSSVQASGPGQLNTLGENISSSLLSTICSSQFK